MRQRLVPAFVLFLLLSGCEPGTGLAWEQEFEKPIDVACVATALQGSTSELRRRTYVAENRAGIPDGTQVVQFSYADPTSSGAFRLELAKLPNGRTHYRHEWAKIGTAISPAERDQVVPLLNRVNGVVAEQCGLSFKQVSPVQSSG